MFDIFKKFINKDSIGNSSNEVEEILDVLNGKNKIEAIKLPKETLDESVYEEAYNYIEDKTNSSTIQPLKAIQGYKLNNVPEFDIKKQPFGHKETTEEEIFDYDEQSLDFAKEFDIEDIPESEFQYETTEHEEITEEEIFDYDEQQKEVAKEFNIEDISESEFQYETTEHEEVPKEEIFDYHKQQNEAAQEFDIEDISESEFQYETTEHEEVPKEEIFDYHKQQNEVAQEFDIEDISESEFQYETTEHEEVPEEEIFDYHKQQKQGETSESSETIVPQGLFGFSFAGLKEAVSKTSEFFNSNILSLGAGKQEIDDDLLDQMEEKLIRADIGIDTTVYIIERLRENKNKVKPDKLKEYLKNEFSEIIKAPGSNILNLKSGQLNTFLITGVNGAGKTTLIGKLAYRFKLQEKKVLVAAGDTFRAAAEDQLEIWANRAGADIVRQDGADPASVVFDAIKKAQAENYDVLLIDTAGRLHNKFNLMEELRKIKKVIDKETADTLVESILVLDATTGQNGLKQAEVFKEAVDLTSVGLTKLDGTAKGGVILGIARQLNLPVRLIGVGEKMEDLRDFSADDFIEALF